MHFDKKQNNFQAHVNLTECLTGTYWLTDGDAGTKLLNRDCPGQNGTYGGKPNHQRWLDSGFLLSDPILFLKNDIRIRSESCFGWNHLICIRKLSKSALWCTTYICVLCLFCLMRQLVFSCTRLV